MSLPQRFWRKVHKTDTCWLWQGGISKGYGRFWWKGRCVQAHRLCYELLVAAIPDGFEVDHMCRNRACVNPDHLAAADHRSNVLLGVGPSAVNYLKLCCPLGHPYATVERKDRSHLQQRRCNTCRNERAKLAARRKTEADFKKGREARRAKWAELWNGV